MPLVPEAGGSIVNITSIEASRAAPGFGVYAAMKAAVESLTKTLALELAGRRIRVNCIAPDAIPTPGDSGLAASVLGEEHVDYGWKIRSPRTPFEPDLSARRGEFHFSLGYPY